MPDQILDQLKTHVSDFWEIRSLLIMIGRDLRPLQAWRICDGRVLGSVHLRRYLIGIMVAMTNVFPSLTRGKIVTAIGLGSIAVDFAFKDIFENFIAGMLILFREPFRLGDDVECDQIDVRVEEITFTYHILIFKDSTLKSISA